MQLERPTLSDGASADLDGLRSAYENADAEDLIEGVFAAFSGQVALISSFGADAAVLLHMVSRVDPFAPVLLVDTMMLFEETLDYQLELTTHLGLRNVQRVSPDPSTVARHDENGDLHRQDPDKCCSVRKVEPLELALQRWPVTISGRKRFQSRTRATLDVFEIEGNRISVNPLARWNAQDVSKYLDLNGLPKHPLVEMGYPSIGCAPCTSKIEHGETARAGRWRGSKKTECGIHFAADTGSVRTHQAGVSQ